MKHNIILADENKNKERNSYLKQSPVLSRYNKYRPKGLQSEQYNQTSKNSHFFC